MNTKQELSRLTDTDIYSLTLFALYKIKDIPEYSTLSELAYILDKDNLLKICEYFGGKTIQIPTIDELELIIYSLLLYQYVNIKNVSFEEALPMINCKEIDLRIIKTNYNKLCEILDKYRFENRG